MNTYSSLKKRKNGILAAAVSLLLCVAMTATMLFSRLVAFSPADGTHYIPLTQSGGLTTVVAENRPALYTPGRSPLLAASPFLSAHWFKVTDENIRWKGQTDIEIFRISYKNGSGEVTVKSGNGESLLAPGTENTYSFALENTWTVPVHYEMEMEAYFNDWANPIPVVARVYDYKGNFYAGTAGSYDNVMALNQVAVTDELSVGHVHPFTLQWQWPFEGNDAYDTYLGNLAEDKDITLTIVIKTYATCDTYGDGGIPKTGDTSHIHLMFAVMIASGAALVVMVLLYRREEKKYEA